MLLLHTMANTLPVQTTCRFLGIQRHVLQHKWKSLSTSCVTQVSRINNFTKKDIIQTTKCSVSTLFSHRYLLSTFDSNLYYKTVSDRTLCTSVICYSNRWCVGKPFQNPLEDLQQFMTIPVLDPKDYVFKPNELEIQEGQGIFQPRKGQLTQPNRGVVDLSNLPPADLPEVCFIGRSNVGKSSLIKALFHDTTDVKISISAKPGHTRSLKFYNITKAFCLVDMPGYGFRMPEYFVQSVEEYIKTRTSLQRVFLLIDASVGLTKTDEQGIDMLEEFGKPYVVVLTKIDKTGHHRILKHFMQFKEKKAKLMFCCFPQPFLVSAMIGAGLPLLRAFIAHITGHLYTAT